MSRLVLAACAAAAAWSFAVAQPPPPTPTPDPKPTPVPVPVVVVVDDFNTLAETFATNAPRADALYVGKTVRVTGTLSRVAANPDAGTDGADAYQMTLRAKGGWPADVEVTFLFPRAARRQLAQLTAGTVVVLEGKCDRPVAYPADGRVRLKDFVTVAVADCTLIGIVPSIPPPAYVLTAAVAR